MRARFRIASLALSTLALAGCSRDPKSPAAPEIAAVTAIGGPSGRYVGSDACGECHASEFAAWSGSRHHSTLRLWVKGQPLRLASSPLPANYRVEADGTAAGPDGSGKELAGSVAFLIGGRHREDAMVRLDDGRLQVFPIAFDADLGKPFEPLREISGGTPPPPNVVDFWTRVGRNADMACYGCHATGQTLTVVGRSPAGLALPGSKWVEPGVGCEGCHGPGGPHVDAARAGAVPKGSLRMTRGGGSGAIDVCAACHGLRDVLPSPFAASPAHRYGEPLTLAANPQLAVGANAEFRDAFFADLRPATFQQEAVAFSQSGCARKGGMTCGACHDVHSGAPVPALEAKDGGDSICAPCHAGVVAAGSKHSLHPKATPGGRCLDCHMAPILRGPAHAAARDHSMAPPVAGPGHVPSACVVCHAKSEGAAAISAAWRRMPQGPAAKRRLEIAEAIDAAPDRRAAMLARVAGDRDRGWFLRWAALDKLADTSTGTASDGVRATVRAALTDADPAVRRAAARALGVCGKPADIAALQTATDDADPWAALEAVHAIGRLGSPTAGSRLLQLLKRPDLIADARAQYMAGHGSLIGQDMPRAEQALRRALELNPMIVGAMNDLGLALVGQGKKDEAIVEWTRALDISPRFTAARANLDAATSASPPAK